MGSRYPLWFCPVPTSAFAGVSIDFDLRASAAAVRVTDYKTGKRPKVPEQVNVGGGAELQRVLYSLACRQLLPDTKPLVARLIYLRPPIVALPLKNPDHFIDLVSACG